MIPLYPIHHQSVKQKGTTFKTSLILLSIEIYSLILNILGKYMYQFNILSFPSHFNHSVKWTYNFLLSNYPLFESFHIKKPDLAKRVGIGVRQLERHLKIIDQAQLIQRDYDTIETEERKIGNGLYLTLTPPTKLTFNAKFDEIEEINHKCGHTTTMIRFRDIYSIDDEDISLNYTWHDNPKPKELPLLKSLESGDRVYFEAEVKLNEQGKQWLDKIKNIRESRIL